jgi:hypothetical protein
LTNEPLFIILVIEQWFITLGGDYMPGFDGTGPAGMGPMTGRGRGYCVVPLNSTKGTSIGGYGLQGYPGDTYYQARQPYNNFYGPTFRNSSYSTGMLSTAGRRHAGYFGQRGSRSFLRRSGMRGRRR